MTLNEFQGRAAETANYPRYTQLQAVDYCALGLTEEAGEVSGKVKRIHRDDGNIISEDRKKQIVLELGDVIWYVARMASELNISLNDVAEANYRKLMDRKARGKLGGEGDNR